MEIEDITKVHNCVYQNYVYGDFLGYYFLEY